MDKQTDQRCRHLPDASAWALGALDERSRRRFEAHLVHCPRCAAEAEAVRGLGARLRSQPEAVPSAG
ncbi:MAG: zf-HC2 domain-containing protein, partial [Kiritimatiellae bacterium]|nr:zf-HC2 domain-containing protein [Kiritimatiellia bacterium]